MSTVIENENKNYLKKEWWEMWKNILEINMTE